jgi:hypothetical protein
MHRMTNEEQRPPLTFEQRLDAITEALAVGNAAFDARIEALPLRHEAMTERHQALTMNMELAWRDIESGRALREQDAQHIHALVRLAEIHEHRLTDLDGPHQK